jgi:hypothetical protein
MIQNSHEQARFAPCAPLSDPESNQNKTCTRVDGMSGPAPDREVIVTQTDGSLDIAGVDKRRVTEKVPQVVDKDGYDDSDGVSPGNEVWLDGSETAVADDECEFGIQSTNHKEVVDECFAATYNLLSIFHNTNVVAGSEGVMSRCCHTTGSVRTGSYHNTTFASSLTKAATKLTAL